MLHRIAVLAAESAYQGVTQLMVTVVSLVTLCQICSFTEGQQYLDYFSEKRNVLASQHKVVVATLTQEGIQFCFVKCQDSS